MHWPNKRLEIDIMDSNFETFTFKPDYYDTTGVYSTVITVYIVIAVILVALTVGGCIIVCICGRPKMTPGRVLHPPSTNQAQGAVPTVVPVMPVAMPGTFGTASQQVFFQTGLQPGPNAPDKSSPPPGYDETVNTGFVNPMYH